MLFVEYAQIRNDLWDRTWCLFLHSSRHPRGREGLIRDRELGFEQSRYSSRFASGVDQKFINEWQKYKIFPLPPRIIPPNPSGIWFVFQLYYKILKIVSDWKMWLTRRPWPFSSSLHLTTSLANSNWTVLWVRFAFCLESHLIMPLSSASTHTDVSVTVTVC